MDTSTTSPAAEREGAAAFAAAGRTRATGAGLDPHEYARVTAALASVSDWGPAFVRTGESHLRRAEGAASARSAGEHLLAAARWFHVATLAPSFPEAPRAAAAADRALGRALAALEPRARRVAGEGFTGWLRGAAEGRETVLVVPGLDSAKEEFLDLASALLARGPEGPKRRASSAAPSTSPPLAPRITAPLLVVDGGQDVVPGVTNGEELARAAPYGTYLSVPHGDHLLGNARPD